MERVEELRQQLKDAFVMLQDVQRNKWQFMQKFQNTIMEIVIKEVSENFRTSVGEYFDMRNEHLHATLKDMDESLNQASMVHTDITALRLQLLHACNEDIQPPFTSQEDTVMINGGGMTDLQNVSSEAEHIVMQVSELQEQSCGLVTTLAENITQMVDTMLSEVTASIKRDDEERLKEAQELWQHGDEELNKAVQVLQSMEKVKQQIECLCRILRKPDI